MLFYLTYGLYELITIYSWILVIYAFMSWFPGIAESFLGKLVTRIVSPYLHLFDRIPTRFGVFDFQVMLGFFVLLGIQRLLLLTY